MRAGVLVVLAALLAGCTDFPAGSRVVLEAGFDRLAPGDSAVRPFTLDSDGGFLVAGFRYGPDVVVHAVLRAPNSTAFATLAGEPPTACAVTGARGAWALEVRVDALSREVNASKFTVRASPGRPPSLLACVDEEFPGRGRSVTLAAWDVNLTSDAPFNATFPQPYPLASMRAELRGGRANATFLLAPPDGAPASAVNVTAPARGTWRIEASLAPSEAPAANVTLAVVGVGA